MLSIDKHDPDPLRTLPLSQAIGLVKAEVVVEAARQSAKLEQIKNARWDQTRDWLVPDANVIYERINAIADEIFLERIKPDVLQTSANLNAKQYTLEIRCSHVGQTGCYRKYADHDRGSTAPWEVFGRDFQYHNHQLVAASLDRSVDGTLRLSQTGLAKLGRECFDFAWSTWGPNEDFKDWPNFSSFWDVKKEHLSEVLQANSNSPRFDHSANALPIYPLFLARIASCFMREGVCSQSFTYEIDKFFAGSNSLYDPDLKGIECRAKLTVQL